MVWLAVVLALASAMSTALSTSFQHHSAGIAGEQAGGLAMLGRLVRRPLWLTGQVLGVGAFVFHGLAMGFGPLTLVQPIVISGIALAVPIRSAISRTWPGRAEIGAVVLTVVSLAAFLLASHPRSGPDVDPGWSLGVPVLVGIASAGVVLAVSGRIGNRTYRAFALGVAAGVLFGLVAVLLKAFQVAAARDGAGHALLSWLVPALVVTGVGGVAVNQFAYSLGRLSASMPVLNVVDGAVALACGWLVFQEPPQHSVLAVAVQVACVVGLCVGLWTLARYEHPEQVSRP